MDDLPNVHATAGARLPLRTSPLIFALRNSDKTTEILWGVGVARGRNVFIYCSSRYPDDAHWHGKLKRALRRVGHNEVSLAPGILMHLLPGQCLWLSWPEHRATDVVLPCYTLYMPDVDWGVRLTDEERTGQARKFRVLREPHVMIDGVRGHDKVIAISLLRLKRGRSVDRVDGRPVSTMGVLSFNADYSVHVTVALDIVERLREVREQINGRLDLLASNQRYDWSEEKENLLFATMGNDEVGYVTVVRQPTAISVSASDIGVASEALTK